tara:strand:+ start:478 stop:945 length:468 start_codon:yes stop_codon:yes gene_type:complete
MYHTTSQGEKMLSAEETVEILTKGISECRHLMYLAVRNQLPINEAPCFAWNLNTDGEKENFQTFSSKKEAESLFLKIVNQLESVGNTNPLCGIIPMRKEEQVGYLVFVVESEFRSTCFFQYAPLISDEKKLLFNEPQDVDFIEVLNELTGNYVYH